MISTRLFISFLCLSLFLCTEIAYTQNTTEEQAQQAANEAKADAERRRAESLKSKKDLTPEAHKKRLIIDKNKSLGVKPVEGGAIINITITPEED